MDSAWRTAQASCIELNSIFTRIQNIDANRVLWWVGVSFPILTSSNEAFMFLVYPNGQFTGQTAEGCYGRSQSDPQLLVFTLLCNHPPECEQDRWLLTNRTRQRWWDATPMIIFHYIKLCLSRVTLVLEGVSHYVMNFPWGGPCGRELQGAWRTEAFNSNYKPLRNEFCEWPDDPGNKLFPNWDSKWECSPLNALIAALWDSEERKRLSRVRQVTYTNCEIKATKFGDLLYSNT